MHPPGRVYGTSTAKTCVHDSDSQPYPAAMPTTNESSYQTTDSGLTRPGFPQSGARFQDSKD